MEGFVTTDNVAVGAKGRHSLLTSWVPKGEVAIIEGKAGNASGEARRNGATEAFKKASQIRSLSPASLPTGTVLKHWMSPLTCCNVIRILKRSIARMTRWQWVLLRQSQTLENGQSVGRRYRWHSGSPQNGGSRTNDRDGCPEPGGYRCNGSEADG